MMRLMERHRPRRLSLKVGRRLRTLLFSTQKIRKLDGVLRKVALRKHYSFTQKARVPLKNRPPIIKRKFIVNLDRTIR